MRGRPTTEVDLAWSRTGRDRFRGAIADMFFTDPAVIDTDTMPADRLDELRRKISRRTLGTYRDKQEWDVDRLADQVKFDDVTPLLMPPVDYDERIAFFEAFGPDRIVTTGRDGRLFLFDEVKRCIYLSPVGRIDYKFDYKKAAAAADAVGTRSFAMWPLRNL